MVVPDYNAHGNFGIEIQKGAAWSKLLANIRLEPKDHPPLSDRD